TTRAPSLPSSALAAGAANRDAQAPLAATEAPFLEGAMAQSAAQPGVPAAAGFVSGGEATVRLAVDPMVGRVLERDPDHLLLYRTVLVEQQGFRQGLLIESKELSRWLEHQVLAPSGLSEFARAHFFVPRHERPPEHPDGNDLHLYTHFFGEPFDALAVSLALEPLPGMASAATVYALSALLVLIAGGGLFALYRMVAVVVHFAERRNNFVAAVSHELKTPLTSIRMYGEMLRDGLVDSEEKRSDYYRTITDESERLSRLIDNVLEFSRLEKGQRELALRVGPVDSVLEEVAAKLRPHALREGFALRVQIEAELPALRFDRDALLQVLFNLVDNAMKYAADSTQREVVLEARREGERIAVSVRDYGPGVAKRHLAQLFEPFYRAESELTRSAKGTGIGLALVRELAEQMGAVVSGQNAEGGGFRVELAFSPAQG
ncbi:MAG: HAMP domain-containing sensor histidine kinase, partial [Myxococcota bacterium]